MPVVAAAGVAALREVRDGDHVRRARALAERLIEGFNAVFAELGVQGFAYGRSSLVRLGRDPDRLVEGWGPLAGDIRKAMLLEGVDLMRVQAFVSSAHTEADIDFTVSALERALRRLSLKAAGG